LLARATFGPRPQDLQDVATMGWEAWIRWQIDWKSIDDRAMEQILEQIAFPNADAVAVGGFLARMLHSRRQLQMRMTAFWENHFNTDLAKARGTSEALENDQFRKHAFGNLE